MDGNLKGQSFFYILVKGGAHDWGWTYDSQFAGMMILILWTYQCKAEW